MWLCINDWVVHEWTQVHFDQFALHGAVQLTDVLTFVIISQCLLIMQNFDANLYFKNVYSWQFMIFHSVEGSAIEEIKQLWMWWWCHSVHLLTKSCKRGSLLEQQTLIARLEVKRVTTFFSPINSCNRVVKPDCLMEDLNYNILCGWKLNKFWKREDR